MYAVVTILAFLATMPMVLLQVCAYIEKKRERETDMHVHVPIHHDAWAAPSSSPAHPPTCTSITPPPPSNPNPPPKPGPSPPLGPVQVPRGGWQAQGGAQVRHLLGTFLLINCCSHIISYEHPVPDRRMRSWLCSLHTNPPPVTPSPQQTTQGLNFYIYNEFSFLALSKLSPVTHSVANTLKRVVIIVASCIVFRTPTTFLGNVGSAIAVLGASRSFACSSVVSSFVWIGVRPLLVGGKEVSRALTKLTPPSTPPKQQAPCSTPSPRRSTAAAGTKPKPKRPHPRSPSSNHHRRCHRPHSPSSPNRRRRRLCASGRGVIGDGGRRREREPPPAAMGACCRAVVCV